MTVQPLPSALPKEGYTPWFSRVLAWLIDNVAVLVLLGIGYGVAFGTADNTCATDRGEHTFGLSCTSNISAAGAVLIAVAYVAALAYWVWNWGYRQGVTGSSIGKSVVKFRVVSEKNGQPIGFGRSILRQLAHVIDGIICYIGYLFPLWDAKRQTLADKIMSTVCVPR